MPKSTIREGITSSKQSMSFGRNAWAKMLRVVARASRSSHWIWPVCGLAAVQAVFSHAHGWLAICLALFSLLLPKKRILTRVLLGAVLGLLLLPAQQPVRDEGKLSEESSYLIAIEEPIRRYQPGGIWFTARILGELGLRDKTKPLQRELRTSCVTPELPWRNGINLSVGEARVIRAVFRKISPEERRVGNPAEYRCQVRYLSKALAQAPRSWLTRSKEHLIDRVQQVLGEHERFGLLVSLSLGERDRLTRQTDEALRSLGLAHFFVVSGYHVGVVFAFVYGALRLLRLLAVRFFSSIDLSGADVLFAYSLSALYVFFVGGDPSAMRALVALTVFCLFRASGSRVSYWNSFLFSFAVISALWPQAILRPGVQLTYAALFGIGLVLTQQKKSSIWKVACSATLCTSAVSVVWFGKLPLIGVFLQPLAGLFLGPLFLPLALLSQVLLAFHLPFSPEILMFVAEGLVKVNQVVLWLADSPVSSMRLESSGEKGVALVCIGALIALLAFPMQIRAFIFQLRHGARCSLGLPIVMCEEKKCE